MSVSHIVSAVTQTMSRLASNGQEVLLVDDANRDKVLTIHNEERRLGDADRELGFAAATEQSALEQIAEFVKGSNDNVIVWGYWVRGESVVINLYAFGV